MPEFNAHPHVVPSNESGPGAFAMVANEAYMFHGLPELTIEPNRFTSEYFYGVNVDTECAHASSGRIGQNRAYCKKTGVIEHIDKLDTVRCKFGVGATTSLGTENVKFPVGNLWLETTMHIANTDVPFRLSLADMDCLKVVFNN